MATHIFRTPLIHFSVRASALPFRTLLTSSKGLFLPFHRYYVWLYEKALREECGYTGAQPYWDWSLSWEDLRKSTVFDGSPYSVGSNGESIPHGGTNVSAFGIHITIAPGTGGGCVAKGPFKNMTVNLGPVAFEPKGGDGGLAYNPRCLVRDISLVWSQQLKPSDVLKVLNGGDTLESFDNVLEALEGVHAGGHFAMGGLGMDAYSSASDPGFWLHHAMVDRLWTIWQNLDPARRTYQVTRTGSAFNGEFLLDICPGFCSNLLPRTQTRRLQT